MKYTLSLLALVAAILPIGVHASPAAESYQQLRREGTICYRQRNYRCALDKFERALALKPLPEMRFNVASAQDKLGLAALAVRQYRRYLKETGSDAPRRAIAHIDRRMKTLLKQVARLQFDLSPAGAQVSLDGVPLALGEALPDRAALRADVPKPPATRSGELVLAPGTHRVEVSRRGFFAQTFTFTLDAGALVKRRVVLKQMPQFGRLSIDSTPAGAELWIDGKLLAARTPASLTKVKAGWRRLQLFTATHAYHRNVQIPPNEEVKMAVTLKAVTGRLRIVSTPPGATIVVDGRQLASTTPATIDCKLGARRFSLSKTGYLTRRHTVRVDVRRPTRQVDVTLQAGGVLQVESSPVGATLTVDGRAVGQTPKTITLAAGSHQIEAQLLGYHSHKRQVAIRAKAQTRLSLSMSATAAQTRLLAERRRKLLWIYSAASVAATSLATMGILYGIGQAKGNDAHASYEWATSDSQRDRWAEDVRAADRMMIAGHVLAGVAAAALSVAAYQLFTRPSLRVAPSRVALEVAF